MRQTALFRLLPAMALLVAIASLVTFPILLTLGAPLRRENRKNIVETVARFIDHDGPQAREQYLDHLVFLGRNLKVLVFSAWLIDEDNRIVAPRRNADPLPEETVNRIVKPYQTYGSAEVQDSFMDFTAAVRLPGTPAQYLVIDHRRANNGFNPLFRTGLFIFVWGVIVTLLVGAGVLIIVFRLKELEASRVIERLAEGDLAARFKISRLDEAGRLMLSFNEMADDIEDLVVKLRHSEQKRTELVQEIGHDLRTPMTSVRLSLESLDLHFSKMTPAQKKAAIRHGLHELAYMNRLIEYLFILSKTGEPSHTVSFQKVDLAQLVAEEMESRQTGERGEGGKLRWTFERETRTPVTLWADPSLISRMVRNVLDNSAKYANAEVVCRLEERPDKTMELHILDDGPGLGTPDDLAKARPSVTPQQALDPEQSLGKGLNIIRAIAALHEWDMEFGAVSQRGTGTRVTFRFLPATHDSRKAA